ncbi:MAG: transglutaminase domain-containing protein, partial [Acidobacteria bacterium]|nr:transglutaminase domain-containing protein [Acidobacteriota bacterium]
MKLLRPMPRAVTRPFSLIVLMAWAGHMAVLVNRSYVQAASTSLATDLARYGSAAQWRGVYYRGEKIGFTVSQTVPIDDGFELQEDGRLQMALLGATTAATIRTTARVDNSFTLRSFEFSLDPGTGAIKVRGRIESDHVRGSSSTQTWLSGSGASATAARGGGAPRGLKNDGPRLIVDITTTAGTKTEVRELAEPPVLPLNLSRRLANGGLTPGARHHWTVFDPATLSNAPAIVDVGKREVVRAGDSRIPAFRVEMEFAGLRTTSWVTDTGEVVREESPMGLMTVRESPERARAMAVPWRVQSDLLDASAVVPDLGRWRIDDPRTVRRLRLRVTGADLSHADLEGSGQSVDGRSIEIRDPQSLLAGPGDPDATRYLAPEPLIESDAPEILAEAELAVRGVTGNRARAERLTRHINGMLQKKPTVSLPSAREVLRTKVGDCNEHTALYVAMARALGIPARIAVGLVYVQGAFYYHAWPEVYLEEGKGPSTLREPRGTTGLRAGPSTSLGASPSTSLRAGPSTSLGASPSTSLRAGRGFWL